MSGLPLRATARNESIVDDLQNSAAMPVGERLKLLSNLRGQQEKALARKPAEPYAWARLSYLRLVTQGDAQDALAALRLSDWVSPEEPRQLPERALMWRQLSGVEDDDAKAYQSVLWQKAFRIQRAATWKLAQQNKITDEVGEALKQRDAALYEEWKARAAEKP